MGVPAGENHPPPGHQRVQSAAVSGESAARGYPICGAPPRNGLDQYDAILDHPAAFSAAGLVVLGVPIFVDGSAATQPLGQIQVLLVRRCGAAPPKLVLGHLLLSEAQPSSRDAPRRPSASSVIQPSRAVAVDPRPPRPPGPGVRIVAGGPDGPRRGVLWFPARATCALFCRWRAGQQAAWMHWLAGLVGTGSVSVGCLISSGVAVGVLHIGPQIIM